MMVETCSIAVVCNGIGSRKWRTRKVLPNAVQPCDPCSNGMARSSPKKASAAPNGWLVFNGLTERGLTLADMAKGQRKVHFL